MKYLGWALALAAVTMTPATAAAPQLTSAPSPASTAAAEPAANAAAPAADAAAAATPAAPAGPVLAPTPGIGVPDGRMGLQDQVTVIGQEAANFHDYWLLTLCVIISVLVAILLGWTLLRYNRRANPSPSRNSHNTLLEVVWTLLPVLVLVIIAVPSISLISKQYSPPPADLTIKVVGHQWYWTYQYPDNGGFELVSNMLKEESDPTRTPDQRFRTDADGPPLLAVDERLVIPVGKVVKFIVTSEDVIHSFAVPAFWTKMDANPGRLNETWVKVDRPGVYFGQCSELCGARHGYMPIAVEVKSEADFNAWLASKGGKTRAEAEAAKKAEEAAAKAAAAPAPAPATAEAAPAAANDNAVAANTAAATN